MLSVAGLEKSYGRHKALDGISFDVASGEFVVLLGPNGAGKTTLVQLVSGLFAPDAGTIRAAEALRRFDLADRQRDRARTLSGGNRRRLELARALLHEPRILLMDEATSGLDPASRSAVLDHILRLRCERGLAVLWTTHLVDEAARADRLLILHRGRIEFSGPPPDLLASTGTATIGEAFFALTGARDAGAGQEL